MQVGDRFPVEELGLGERNGPLVVYFYPQARRCTAIPTTKSSM
jgi:hypothetical protein